MTWSLAAISPSNSPTLGEDRQHRGPSDDLVAGCNCASRGRRSLPLSNSLPLWEGGPVGSGLEAKYGLVLRDLLLRVVVRCGVPGRLLHRHVGGWFPSQFRWTRLREGCK
jgi:hypothetical protein